MTRRYVACFLSALLAALLVSGFTSPAHAQVGDNEVGSNAAMLELFPQLRQLPAPSSITEGLRVTYATGAATAGGGPAGGGLVQYDVIHADGSQVLAHIQRYANDGQGAYPLSAGHARGFPGLGAFWMNPSVLATAETFNSQTLTVTRFDKTLDNGQRANVVRFRTTTQNGATVSEFDTMTGLMVFESLTTATSAAQIRFQGVRQLQLPWRASRAPAWVRPETSVAYEGTLTTNIPSVAPIIQQLQAATTTTRAGARWSLTTVSQAIDNTPQQNSLIASGQAQLLGALWLPTAAQSVSLTTEGVRIDLDPFTKAETWLASDDTGRLVLQQTTPVARTTAIYDRELGILDRRIQELVLTTSSTIYDLSRTTADAGLAALAELPPLPDGPGPTAPTSPPGGSDDGGCQGTRSTGPALLLALTALLLMRRRQQRVAESSRI